MNMKLQSIRSDLSSLSFQADEALQELRGEAVSAIEPIVESLCNNYGVAFLACPQDSFTYRFVQWLPGRVGRWRFDSQPSGLNQILRLFEPAAMAVLDSVTPGGVEPCAVYADCFAPQGETSFSVINVLEWDDPTKPFEELPFRNFDPNDLSVDYGDEPILVASTILLRKCCLFLSLFGSEDNLNWVKDQFAPLI